MDTTTVREQPDSPSSPEAGSSPSPELLAGDLRDRVMVVAIVKLDQFLQELDELTEEKQDTAVSGKQDSRRLPAKGSSLRREMITDEEVVILDKLEYHRERERLGARMRERTQQDKNLTLRIKKLKKDNKKLTGLLSRVDKFLEEEYFNPWTERAEGASQEGREKDAEIKMLKEETARLVERKQELLRQIELHTPYRDAMEMASKRGGFDSAEHFADHITRLIELRDRLIQGENEKLDRIDELKKKLVTMEDHHRLFMLQKHNQLAELDMELEETRAEKLIWEKRWNRIQETATKKTLELGQIKMATLSTYEMTGDTEVNVNDTEKQLDKIKQFIVDNDDIVKRYQAGQGEDQQRRGRAR